jgi:uncharacterized protein (TIGR03437 family)
MERILKNLRSMLSGAMAVAIVALGCANTVLAQPKFQVNGADSTNLSFCGQQASIVGPSSQPVHLTTSDGITSSFTTAISFTPPNPPPPNWIIVTPTSGTSTPQDLTVSINSSNAAALANPGTYTGTITVNPGAGSSDTAAVINVTLSLVGASATCSGGGGSNTLTAVPGAVTLNIATGTQSAIQNLSITNNSASSVTITGAVASGQSFLSLVNTSATTVGPGGFTTFQLTASTATLTSGVSYSGSLTFSTNLAASVSVPVTVNYGTSSGGGSSILSPVPASQTSLTATFALGASGQTASFSVLNNSASSVIVDATASTTTGQLWLTVSPASQSVSAGTTVAFQVTINPTVLGNVAGTYIGSLTFTPEGGGGALTIPVTLNYGTGGSLALNQGSFAVAIASGGSTNTQTLNVTNNFTTSVTLNLTFAGPGLTVTPSGQQSLNPGATASFNVILNPSGLSVGTYNDSITISPVVGSFGTITVPVTLCYGTSGTCSAGGSTSITASPNPLNFTIPAGSSQVSNQTLTVTSSVGAITVTATQATSTGSGWLTVFPTNQTANPTASYTVSVSPQNLPLSGVGTGSITLTPSVGTALVIPVNVNTASATGLTITPSQLSFAYQTGTLAPQPQNLTLSSSSAINFVITSSTNSGGSWLVVSPLSGATAGGGAGTTVTVSINPGSLVANTYTGQIFITNTATAITQAIQVTLLVSNLPILAFSNSGTTFNYQTGSATIPTQQTVQVTSSGTPLTFSTSVTAVSGGSFLVATPSTGTTPQTLTFSLSPSALAVLAPGTYTSNVTVNSSGSGNGSVTYPVTLNVTNNNLLNPSQTSLNFNYQIGQTQPATQIVNISSSGAPLTYSVSAVSTNCGSFLSAAPANGITNSTIAVSVNTTGLPAGLCTGTVSVTSAGAGNSPLNIPVNLYVSNSALLNVSPAAINITTQVGVNPANQTISLTSTDPNNQLTFNVNTAPNSNFLLVGPTSGATPSNLTVGFSTAGLSVGTYTSSLNIAASGPSSAVVANAPVTVPITVVVTSSATASVTPGSLSFTQAFQGSAPANQTLQIAATTTGLTFSATATTFNGGSWLSVVGTNSPTPGTVTVGANGANLNTGIYTGTITIVIPGAANSPINIQVTLTVGPSQALALSSSTLLFNYSAGSSTTPQPQTVQVSSTGGSVAFTATPSGIPIFLSVSTTSNNTPATLTVTLNQAVISALAAGTYSNSITIASPGLTSVTITVSLVVAAAPPPTISTIVNGGSLQPGAVSPGLIVSIFGSNLGPATGVVFTVSGNKVPTTLANVTVTFDGVPAPLLFVRTDQINAIAPYEIGGRVTTNIVVTFNNVSSSGLLQNVVDTSPAVFSLAFNGNGQGAILNSNNSVNGVGNAAAKNSVVQIFATGEGALVPVVATGSITPSLPPFPRPVGNVSVTIGGAPATITYAGEAPGLVSGVLQVNAIVPPGAGSGPQAVVLSVGNKQNNTQQITVQVQ